MYFRSCNTFIIIVRWFFDRNFAFVLHTIVKLIEECVCVYICTELSNSQVFFHAKKNKRFQVKWSIKNASAIEHWMYTYQVHSCTHYYHSGKVSNLLLLTSRYWFFSILDNDFLFCVTTILKKKSSFLSNNEICLLYNKHTIFTLPCNFSCWIVFDEINNIHVLLTCPPTWKLKKTQMII